MRKTRMDIVTTLMVMPISSDDFKQALLAATDEELKDAFDGTTYWGAARDKNEGRMRSKAMRQEGERRGIEMKTRYQMPG